MQTKISFSLVLIICLLYSCNPATEKARIKTKYNIHRDKIIDSLAKLDTAYVSGGLTTTNTYDDTGALISQISSDGSKTVNIRTGNMIISTQTDSTGKVIRKETEFLNEQGESDSSSIEENGKVTSTYKFTYNAQGQRIESKEYTPGGMRNQLRLDYTWKLNFKDSNIFSEVLQFAVMVDTIAMVNPQTLKMDTIIQRMDKPEIITYYDYLMDRLNTTHGFTNSKNLPKRSVIVSGPGDTSQVNNMRYAFDDKGRVVTEVLESVPGPRYKDGTSVQLEYDSSAYTYY